MAKITTGEMLSNPTQKMKEDKKAKKEEKMRYSHWANQVCILNKKIKLIDLDMI